MARQKTRQEGLWNDYPRSLDMYGACETLVIQHLAEEEAGRGIYN